MKNFLQIVLGEVKYRGGYWRGALISRRALGRNELRDVAAGPRNAL
jgi:hypothetical protein